MPSLSTRLREMASTQQAVQLGCNQDCDNTARYDFDFAQRDMELTGQRLSNTGAGLADSGVQSG